MCFLAEIMSRLLAILLAIMQVTAQPTWSAMYHAPAPGHSICKFHMNQLIDCYNATTFIPFVLGFSWLDVLNLQQQDTISGIRASTRDQIPVTLNAVLSNALPQQCTKEIIGKLGEHYDNVSMLLPTEAMIREEISQYTLAELTGNLSTIGNRITSRLNILLQGQYVCPPYAYYLHLGTPNYSESLKKAQEARSEEVVKDEVARLKLQTAMREGEVEQHKANVANTISRQKAETDAENLLKMTEAQVSSMMRYAEAYAELQQIDPSIPTLWTYRQIAEKEGTQVQVMIVPPGQSPNHHIHTGLNGQAAAAGAV